jgi:hypothetical protein
MQGPTMNADPTGLLQYRIPLNVAASAEFTSWGTLFDEWKMIGGEIVFNQLVCPNPASATSFSYAISLHMVYDPDDATLDLSSYASSDSYRTRKVINVGTTQLNLPRFAWKNKPLPLSTSWTSTANLTWPGGIKFYGANFVASQVVAQTQVNYFIRFRTRRMQ